MTRARGRREARWTAADIPDQTGRVAVVTGANSGLGFEISAALAERGATVVLACRDGGRAQEAMARIVARIGAASVETVPLDLADLMSVRSCAAELRARFDRVDLVVDNAGVLMIPHTVTVDGFEGHLAVNHLGHFALVGLLLDRLLATPGSRVVVVGSISHAIGRLDPDDLQGGRRRYSRMAAYARSKLANLLFVSELQRRLSAAGASTIAVSAHPGSSRTEIARHIRWVAWTPSRVADVLQQSAAMGALPVLRAAVDPSVTGGESYGPRGPLQWRGYPELVRTARRARDPDLAHRLWEASEHLTGVTYGI
jgi:NAD(P)-dependent dehydrogenase (short-subunit alcohol dehydrogenase family)